jgi:hypothetical protein
MMLNPKKYVFGVSSEKLLGKLKMCGMMATLSRFISKLGERGIPLYKLL